jgi:hypothetical protein
MSINQSDNWIYGYKQWLTFSGGSAEVVYSGFNNTIVSLNSSRGAASVSDTSGNLLFYTDGVKIWNALGSLITTITTGDTTSFQSATIVPSPYNSNYYYVFSVLGWPTSTLSFSGNQLFYTMIDMTTSNGSLLQQPIPIGTTSNSGGCQCPYSGFGYSEVLTTARHSNGTDFWVIVRKANTTQFEVFKSDSYFYMDTTPVVSNVNTVFGGDDRYGTLKVSPQNDKIAFAVGSTKPTYSSDDLVSLFDFNSGTGEILNQQLIVSGGTEYTIYYTGTTSQKLSGQYSYGCEFSPDGNLLYVTLGNSTSNSNIVQLNLSNISEHNPIVTTIPKSFARLVVNPDLLVTGDTSSNTLSFNRGEKYTIQAANNGKLYFIGNFGFPVSKSLLYEIQSPNTAIDDSVVITVSEVYRTKNNLGPIQGLPNLSVLALYPSVILPTPTPTITPTTTQTATPTVTPTLTPTPYMTPQPLACVTYEISIDTVVGTAPYDIYLCDETFAGCIYLTTTSSLPYKSIIPPPYDTIKYLGVKIIDSDGCSIYKKFNL